MDEKKGVHQAVEDSNIIFYKAFETLSIGKMGQVWKHSDDTICIHPGWGNVYQLDSNKGKLAKDI